MRVFIGTSVILGGLAYSFYGVGKQTKAGHGSFDVDKPEAVHVVIDAAESRKSS
eukprot:CAMPEP_0182427900 /NCGR_PEP_ID=MMETSP1167-20130531/20652_1 /TAXON_ID=2988 /ORGANISM="Mallomonas Sp, Strain CCMP3275" /LENGTH=53 /DNA_ID=CAMNT_0024610473 /DNA_START=169 /DNA_END=330 /DNA_ORIENTATION=+